MGGCRWVPRGEKLVLHPRDRHVFIPAGPLLDGVEGCPVGGAPFDVLVEAIEAPDVVIELPVPCVPFGLGMGADPVAGRDQAIGPVAPWEHEKLGGVEVAVLAREGG